MKTNRRSRNIIAIIIIVTGFISVTNNLISNPTLLKTLVSVKGKIIDKADNKPIGTNINVLSESGKKIGVFKSNDIDGSYFLTGLRPATKYIFSVEADDDEYQTIEFKTPDVNIYTEMKRDIIIDHNENRIEILSKK